MPFEIDQKEKYLKYSQLKKYTEGVKNYIDAKDTNINNELSQAILDEKIAREISDQQLESYVTTEVKTQLDAEVEAREASEAEIKESIRGLDSSLTEAISNETNIRESSINSLESEIESNLNSLQTSLGGAIEVEVEARKASEIEIANNIENKTAIDESSIIRNDDGAISLNPSYVQYLNNALYDSYKPTIADFSFRNGVSASYEIGKSVTVNGFDHKENNISNIEGTLSLRKGSATGNILVSDISPSTAIATIDYAETVTTNTSYYLTMTTIKPETISSTLSITFYAPAFIITSTAESLTANQIVGEDNATILSRSRKTQASLNGAQSIDLSSNGYLYFITTNTINKMTDPDTGFGFGNTKLTSLALNINGVSKTYNIYRSAYLTPGTYKVTIS